MFTQSLASDRKYKFIQVRPKGCGTLHVQVLFQTPGNRKYGHSADVKVGGDDYAYVSGLKATQPSLAGTDKEYVLARAAVNGETVHIQFEGPTSNRNYGRVVDVKEASLADFLRNTCGV